MTVNPPREEHEEADDIGGQNRLHAVATARVSSLSNAAMIGEQLLRPAFGKGVELRASPSHETRFRREAAARLGRPCGDARIRRIGVGHDRERPKVSRRRSVRIARKRD
jgi:hypothetical protein